MEVLDREAIDKLTGTYLQCVLTHDRNTPDNYQQTCPSTQDLAKVLIKEAQAVTTIIFTRMAVMNVGSV